MKKFLLLVLVVAGLLAYTQYFAPRQQARAMSIEEAGAPDEPRMAAQQIISTQFKCDGRKHCSQMTSCAEATFFLKSCPGVKMDGNGDGVPCERQWCR